VADKVGESYVNLGIRKGDFSAGLGQAKKELKQFGQDVSSMRNTLQAAFAGIVGGLAIGEIWDLAKVRAGFDEQRGILDNLSQKYGTTADAIVSSMREASDGMVSNADLMSTALGGLAKGLSPDQLVELADAAKLLSDVAGTDAATAINDLSQALETGRTRTLKNYLGTTIDITEAMGGLEGKLTDAEKAQALFNLVMQAHINLQGQQNKAVDDGADKMDRMTASYNNAKLALGRLAKGAVAGVYDFMSAAWEGLSSLDPDAYQQRLGDELRAKQKRESERAKKAAADYKAANDKLKAKAAARVAGDKKAEKVGGRGKDLGAPNWMSDEQIAAHEAVGAYFGTPLMSNLELMRGESGEIEEDVVETFETISRASGTMSDELTAAITGWGASFSSTLNDAVWDAELSFSAIAESFGRMITQMIIQKSLVEPVLGAFMEGDLLSSFFEALTMGDVMPMAEGGTITEPIYGVGMSGRRYLFGEGGEHEYVIPGSKMALGAGGSTQNNVTISIVAADARSFSEMAMRNPEAIVGPIRKALRSGDQGLISDMRGVI
jgi:hypothetical protein